MNRAVLYGCYLGLGYLLYRMVHLPELLNAWIAGEGHFGFFLRMPAAPLLLALLPFQFVVARQAFLQGKSGFEAFKEAGKVALLTAVLCSGAVWLYYGWIDPEYLPGLVDMAASELPAELSLEDRAKFMDNLTTLNSLKLRTVFTMSGLTAYGLISGLAMVSLVRSRLA